MKVKDIMRKEFIYFHSDDTLEYVIKSFAKNHITSAPVLDNDEYIGMVSDIGLVEFFTPKKFIFLWKKEKQKSIEEIKKITAATLAKKSTILLKPEDDLSSSLSKIAKRTYSIAVMDQGKLVGIVREEDIITFFLKEFAIDESKSKIAQTDESGFGNMQTEVDRVLEIVRREKRVSASKIAKELGLSIKTVEKLGESLANHHLLEIKYSFFAGPVFRGLEYEKK